MNVQRKSYAASIAPVGERQAIVICSTGEVDRAGEVVVQDGIDLSAYKSNPIVLWQHNVDSPVAKATDIGVVNGKLTATVDFPPPGISAKADEICGLVKSGVISAVSIGFTPTSTEPMDMGNPKKGPQRYLKCELGEFSFVSVPANPNALVVQRQNKAEGSNWKVGASRNLPPHDGEFVAELAAKSILDKAEFGGDHPHVTFARKGFLVYDAADADNEGSYKIPFASVVDDRLTVTMSGIVAAKSLLDESDLPDDVATKARAVLEHYEAKMADKSASVTKDGAALKVKDLYDVAQAAYALASLGYIQNSSAWEAECEGDGSKVPQMLADACRAFADALVAMTAEETAELLAQMTPAGDDAVTKGFCKKDAKSLVKALAAIKVKAGAMFSAANKTKIKGVHKALSDQCDTLMGMIGDADDSSDTTDDSSSTSDTDKSADELRQKRLRDLDLLSVSAA
jgi:HK97 family phage prohead protease